MTCEQAQQLLTQLIWPQVQTRRYAALYQHVQHCGHCQPYWQQWRQDEEQLTTLLAVESAPTGLWEHVMTTIQTEETCRSHGDIWRSIALEVSPQGINVLYSRTRPRQRLPRRILARVLPTSGSRHSPSSPSISRVSGLSFNCPLTYMPVRLLSATSWRRPLRFHMARCAPTNGSPSASAALGRRGRLAMRCIKTRCR